MAALQVGMFIPRGVGDPRAYGQPDHKQIVRYGQRADELGFDSLWVPDHFFFERPKGTLIPYPEAWTTMTALVMRTERARIGSMVLATAFRHPALLAHMAGALQELADGRLVLGVGAGSGPAEHELFGLGYDGRVGRLAEYLEVLTALLNNQPVTLEGRDYKIREGRLMRTVPGVPVWIAGTGPRVLGLAARYAQGWNGGGASTVDGEPLVARVAELRAACRGLGRDPAELEISSFTTTIVSRDDRQAAEVLDKLREINGGVPADEVRDRYVLGTPDRVIAQLRKQTAWGITHFVLSLGAQPSTLWSDETLELFGREVLPALR